jgi:hypothetical protein
MYHSINNSIAVLINRFEQHPYWVMDYINLKNQVDNDAIVIQQANFQNSFIGYWKLKPYGLRAEHRPLYFQRFSELLANTPQNHEEMLINVQHLAEELSNIEVANERHIIPFSACTKLVHMIDDNLPIYDSRVAAFYLWAPSNGIQGYMRFYNGLRVEYNRVIGQNLLEISINNFRQNFPHWNLTNVRIIDLLIWAWVGLIREQHFGLY